MFNKKKFSRIIFSRIFYGLLLLVSLVVLFSKYLPLAQASQYWTALPPYNTLWPLWSPALSPIEPETGLPTPIVTALTSTTKLAIQPGLTWDPYAPYPWLLYCTPLGLAYYDPYWRDVDLWPPAYLKSYFELPLPLTLPASYQLLPPSNPSFLLATVPLANAAAQNYLVSLGIPPSLIVYLTASALI